MVNSYGVPILSQVGVNKVFDHTKLVPVYVAYVVILSRKINYGTHEGDSDE